jgi:glycosyltransferase involved in cell wall biosynthesis
MQQGFQQIALARKSRLRIFAGIGHSRKAASAFSPELDTPEANTHTSSRSLKSLNAVANRPLPITIAAKYLVYLISPQPVSRQQIFFSYPTYISFVRNDEAMLRRRYDVVGFHFNQLQKWAVPFEFIRHLVAVFRSVRRTDAFVSFFAGYSSFVPALLAQLFGKPHIIILGGTDCVSLPEIGYGNFQKRLLGWCTCQSLKRATHLAPVSENLVDSAYVYFPTRFKRQGYKAFCSEALAPHTVIPIGYDPSLFKRLGDKKQRSFLCVAQMNKANFFRKGIDLVFEMAVRFPTCTFTVVGDNEKMQYDYVPQNVTLMPFVPYEALAKIYSEHQFYLQLSLMEGFPSAPCEAMLCECVPIVSAVGAMEEIVGDTGFVLKYKDVAELETLLGKALETDTDELGCRARARIVTRFPPAVRDELVHLIESEIGRVTNARP